MKIDLNNYEVWMMDYLEGNLDDQQSNEMKAFLLKHPHIAEDLDGLADIQLIKENDLEIDPQLKSKLLIQETENIDADNFEITFAAYYENDLEESDKKELEDFLKKNEFLRDDFESFEHLKLKADTNIVFTDKNSLIKSERKTVPLWLWSGLVAAIMVIGFWILIPETEHRASYSPDRMFSKSVQSIAILEVKRVIPGKKETITMAILIDDPDFERLRESPPPLMSSLQIDEIKSGKMKWHAQMELMQEYAFERNQLQSQVDWATLPSENSKKGFRLIASFLWKTTKSQMQSLGEEVFNEDIEALSYRDLGKITGGMISVKRPVKEKE